jgi:hypothetical protein
MKMKRLRERVAALEDHRHLVDTRLSIMDGQPRAPLETSPARAAEAPAPADASDPVDWMAMYYQTNKARLTACTDRDSLRNENAALREGMAKALAVYRSAKATDVIFPLATAEQRAARRAVHAAEADLRAWRNAHPELATAVQEATR